MKVVTPSFLIPDYYLCVYYSMYGAVIVVIF